MDHEDVNVDCLIYSFASPSFNSRQPLKKGHPSEKWSKTFYLNHEQTHFFSHLSTIYILPLLSLYDTMPEAVILKAAEMTIQSASGDI